MNSNQLEELRGQLASRNTVVIVGGGVSRAITNNAARASWRDLLRCGISHAEAVVTGLPDGWGKRQRSAIEAGDHDEALSVAELVARKLGAPQGGEYRRWLAESVGSLTVQNRGLVEALLRLRAPLCTTNYDGLLESVTKMRAVSWREPIICERVLRGDENGIIHLHGFWEDPESVVLGLRSYEDAIGDGRAQAMLRALRMYRSLLFIGFDEDTYEENLDGFVAWADMRLPSAEFRFYWVARNDRIERKQQVNQRFSVLGYGQTNTDLETFLQEISPSMGGSVPTRWPAADVALLNAVQLYRAEMARSSQRIRFVDLASRAEDREIPLGLDRLPIFIPQRLSRIAARRGAPDATWAMSGSMQEERSDANFAATVSIDHVLRDEKAPLLVLLGAPGSGKSEITLWLVAKLCTPGESLPGVSPEMVPVRIEMRLFDGAYGKHGAGYDFFVFAASQLKERAIPLDEGQLRDLAREGRILWLFDGMDEVRHIESRRRFAEMIHGLLQGRMGRAIVTSRTAGSAVLLEVLQDAVGFQIQDFNQSQISEFIDRWHRLAFFDDASRGQSRKLRLVHALDRSQTLSELCRSPLLLTLLALLNRSDELPRRRHLVFQRAVELMLSQWEANKNLSQGEVEFEREDKLRYLRELAWSMQSEKWTGSANNAISHPDLLRFTADFCQRQFNLDRDRAEGRAGVLIDYLEQRNHTLTYLGGGLYAFAHKTFLEYLAAEALVRFHKAEEIDAKFRQSWRFESWREVFCLACGLMDDADQCDAILRVLQSLIRQQPFSSAHACERAHLYAFAIRCLAEVRQVQTEPLRSLIQRLMQLVQQDEISAENWEADRSARQAILDALGWFGPRWPTPDAWIDWAVHPTLSLERHIGWVWACSVATALPGLQKRRIAEFMSQRPDLVNEAIEVVFSQSMHDGLWDIEDVPLLLEVINKNTNINQSKLGYFFAEQATQRSVRWLVGLDCSSKFYLGVMQYLLENGKSEDRPMILDYAEKCILAYGKDIITKHGYTILLKNPDILSKIAWILVELLNDSQEIVQLEAASLLLESEYQALAVEKLKALRFSSDTKILSALVELYQNLGFRDLSIQMINNTWNSDSIDNQSQYYLIDKVISAKTDTALDIDIIEFAKKRPEALQYSYDLWRYLVENEPRLISNRDLEDIFYRYAIDGYPSMDIRHASDGDPQLSFQISEIFINILNRRGAGIFSNETALFKIAFGLFKSAKEGKDTARKSLHWLATNALDHSVRLRASVVISDIDALFWLAELASDKETAAKATSEILKLSEFQTEVNRRLSILLQSTPHAEVQLLCARKLFGLLHEPELQESGRHALDRLATTLSVPATIRMEAAEELALYPVLAQLSMSVSDDAMRNRTLRVMNLLDLQAEILGLGRTTHRAGRVYLDGRWAGNLEETDRGSRFYYLPEWLRNPVAESVSLTLPLRREPFDSDGLHPFFENLLPEGWYLELVAKKVKLRKDDKFGLLLATGADCAGSVEIRPDPEHEIQS